MYDAAYTFTWGHAASPLILDENGLLNMGGFENKVVVQIQFWKLYIWKFYMMWRERLRLKKLITKFFGKILQKKKK